MKSLRAFLAVVLAGLILHGVTLPRVAFQPRLFDGTLLEATYTPTPIKSLQQLSGTSAATITLSPAVTVASTLLIAQGMSTTNAGGFVSGFAAYAYAQLTNSTTVTLTAGSTTPIWKGVAVEFLPQFVKSQGCNTISIASASLTNTSTITAVTVAKTIVASTGWKSDGGSSEAIGAQEGTVVLTNTTTITATKGAVANESGGAPNFVAGYCYVEFK